MKWLSRRSGDTRIRSRFAWLPVEMCSRETVWLERYLSFERFCNYWYDYNGPSWYVERRQAI